MRSQLLSACWQYGVKLCRGEVADPVPGYTRALRIALRCIVRGREELAARIAATNPTARSIWAEAFDWSKTFGLTPSGRGTWLRTGLQPTRFRGFESCRPERQPRKG